MPNGLVLAGAAALGAYEAGVLRYVLEELGADGVRFDVLSGTSAGAINASALGALADDDHRASHLCDAWAALRLGHVLQPSAVELLWMFFDLTGGPERVPGAARIRRRLRGALFDPRPREKIFTHALPMDRLAAQLAARRLSALALTATEVATGRAVVFFQARRPTPAWPVDPSLAAVPTRLGAAHALASSAIPLLFPPVAIDGDLYCDGGLRQLVPLAPALHLGADRLLVIDPLPAAGEHAGEQAQARRQAVASPVYLAGKALQALFADRMEADLARVRQINAVLHAGARRYGARFRAQLNRDLGALGHAPLREVEVLTIRPSQDLGPLAVDCARDLARDGGLVGRFLACLAAGDPARSGDLLSFLLLDGRFAARLIEQGRADARARRDELGAFFRAPARATRTPAR